MTEQLNLTDRELAAEWAAGILSNDNWCILDTETTGLGDDAQICQIGVLHSDRSYQNLVRPTIPIDPVATNIHGITDDAVKSANSFDWEFLNVLRSIGKKDVIIYNAEFDLRLIRQSLRAQGIQIAFPSSDRRQCRIFTNGGAIHCAMKWYSQWVGEWNNYYGNYKWQRLPGGDHSALGDCVATLKVLQQMAAEGEAKPDSLNDIAF